MKSVIISKMLISDDQETKHKETGDNDTPTKTPKNKATMDVKQPVPVRNKQDKVMEKKYLDWVYDDGELGPLRDHQARMGSMIALREWTDEGIAWREFCEARGGRGELV